MKKEKNSKWERSLVFIKKNKLNTWRGFFALVFAVGGVVTLIWIIVMHWVVIRIEEPTSKASGESAVMSLKPQTLSNTVITGDTFKVDVMLDTKGKNVIVAKTQINYDPQYFSLESWDTSGSAFASGDSCVYNGNPCAIVTNDTSSGKLSITQAKPTPGINTASGNLGTLTFKALKAYQATSPDLMLAFSGPGKYDDSDAIVDDGQGTDILASVSNVTININDPAIACTGFTYSAWGACQSNNTQTRTVTASTPAGCTGGNPVLTQSCTYNNTCTSFTYSAWGACQSNNTQTRTVTASTPAGCTGGNPVLTQSCTYNNTCTGFTYSAWGDCKNRTRTRGVLTSSPQGCSGGNPVLTKSCSCFLWWCF